MNLIWATRGRSWGFRFLRSGGFDDPLPVYDEAFAGVEDRDEVCRRAAEHVALRFPDPHGRQDAAGRAISHDFVLLGADLEPTSVDEGRRLVWALVADEFDDIWELPAPPPPG